MPIFNPSTFNFIIANFQWSGNPIEAFLNCSVKDVERKEGAKNKKQKTDGEGADGNEGEGGGDGDESKGGDGKGEMGMSRWMRVRCSGDRR